jgi:membrane associated rhomboid family serine protease
VIRVRIGSEQHDLGWEEWEDRVRRGRVPRDALVQFEAVTGDQWVVASELELYRSLRNDAAIAWQGDFLRGPPPIVTALLVGVQIRVWWLARIPDVRQELVSWFTNWASPALENGEVWRPLTMGFLHTDLFHLVLNMLWLAYTGWNIERALGRRNLLTIYVAAVLGGATLSMFGSPQTPSLGASGGVFGLVAASTVFGFVRPDLLPARGRRLFGAAMLPYLLLMFWSGLMNEDTDNWSHFGGLVVGAVLGLLLDPVPLQRKPGWNARLQRGVVAASALLFATLWLGGARLLPLVDSEVARREASRLPTPAPADPRADDAALRWSVPAGWRPAVDLSHLPAFASRAGERSFGVRHRQVDTLTTARAEADRWLEELRDDWPDAVASSVEAMKLAGHDALTMRVRPAPDDAHVVQWFGATHGVHVLEAVWVVESDRDQALQPLLSRMLDRIRWSGPPELAAARAEVAFAPRSTSGRRQLALELGRWGETEEALRLHLELIDEAPDDPDRWEELFDTLALGGVPPAGQAPLWDRALREAPVPRVIEEVARSLDVAEQGDVAIGLLEIAWSRRPGDRRLRRARRGRGLSVELDDRGVPWGDAHVPATGAARSDEELQALRDRPLTLPAARDAGVRWRAEHDEVVSTVCAAFAGSPEEAWPGLLWLYEGALPPADSDAPQAVLDALEEPATARWMPEALVACLPGDAAARLSAGGPAPRR